MSINNTPTIEPRQVTGIFTDYIAKTLPLAFDDSMSYYECLCALLKYINDTIVPDINNVNSGLGELQEFYEKLQSYVNNYFDNLDVQEEINNKLDEMAESGELTDIIAQYLGLAGMITFDTVAEMKLAENLVNGSKCITLGYHSANDGGGAIYKIRQITNDDVIDEASIIAVYNDLLVAELITDVVNLNQFGCYGDGEHDDTNNLNKAISYAENKNMTLTSANDKEYKLSELITFGDINIDLSNIIFLTDYGIKISEANSKELNLPKITAISTLSTYNAIELFECYTNNIFIKGVDNYTKGLILTANTKGCCYNTINIQEIHNTLTAIELYPTGTGWTNENLFIGGRLWNNVSFTTEHGSSIAIIYLHGNNDSHTNNNYFLHQCVEGNEGTYNGVKLKLENARYNVFEQLRYEGTDAKIYATDSLYNVLNNGYNLQTVTFTNDEITRYMNGRINQVRNAGDGTFDIQLAGNSYSSLLTRRIDGTIASKITPNGIIACDTSGNETIKLDSYGIQGYDGANNYIIIRPYSKQILVPNCDGTNRAFVINNTGNVTNGCFLWVYDGHLYGKIGKPNSASDGTIIL